MPPNLKPPRSPSESKWIAFQFDSRRFRRVRRGVAKLR